MGSLYSEVKNNSTPLDFCDIPLSEYSVFYAQIAELLNFETNHCLAYYCHELEDKRRLYCCIADDITGSIKVFCHGLNKGKSVLKSLTLPVRSFIFLNVRYMRITGLYLKGIPG